MQISKASPYEREQMDRLAFEPWGKGLSPDEFKIRQYKLQNQAWSKDHQENWVLKDDHGTILSSCETFRTPSFLRLENQIEGVSYIIASVVTPFELRGRGYCYLLLDQVYKVLMSRPGVQSLTLFSEVGDAIYGRNGFVAVPSKEIEFSAERVAFGKATLLTESEILLKNIKQSMSIENYSLLLPVDHSHLIYQIGRQNIYCDLQRRPRPKYQGVAYKDSFLVWVSDHNVRTLRGLFLQQDSPGDSIVLIEGARRYAAEQGLDNFRIWKTESTTIEGGVEQNRGDSVAMFRLDDSKTRSLNWVEVHRALWV